MDNSPDPGASQTARAGGTRTPRWIWVFLVVVGGLILASNILFKIGAGTRVDYSPWFLDQVEADNIASLEIDGAEVRGVPRKPTPYRRADDSEVTVSRFVTYVPDGVAIAPILRDLRHGRKPASPSVRITGVPPRTGAGPLFWITFLLPTFLIVGMIYFMLRQARVRAGRRVPESSP